VAVNTAALHRALFLRKKRQKKTKTPKKRGRKGQSPPGIRRKKRQRRGVICPSFFEGTGGGWPGFNDPFFNGKKKHSTTTKDRKTRQTTNNPPLPAFSRTPDYHLRKKRQNILALQNRTTCKTTYHNEGTKGRLLPDFLFLIT